MIQNFRTKHKKIMFFFKKNENLIHSAGQNKILKHIFI